MSGYILDLRKEVGHRPLLQVGASVLVEKNNSLLLIHRKDNDCYSQPGGSIELDEKVEEAAKRELYEETGLIANQLELFKIYSGKELHYIYPNGDEVSNIDIVYLCKDFSGTLKPQKEEAFDVAFYPIQNLPEPISPPVKMTIQDYLVYKQSKMNLESYNKVSSQWNEYRQKMNPCLIDFIDPLKKESLVLDIGCGTGFVDRYLVSKGMQVEGIDPSSEMLAYAKDIKGKFSCCNLFDYKTDKQYDAIIAFDVLWHIPYHMQREIYPMIASLLKEGGVFLFTHGLTDSEIYSEMFNEPFYNSSLDIKELKQILKENHLEVVKEVHHLEEEITGTRDLLMIVRKNNQKA